MLQLESKATGKRLSKFQRSDAAPGHVLNDRDMAIVAAVANYKLLSRSQIQRLFGFGNSTRVNFRLIRLFQHSYLARHYLPTVHGSSQAIYVLDRLGLPVAAERLGKDAAELWRPKESLKPLFLNHQMAVNDVRIAFELAARAHDDHRLLIWLPEEEVKDRFFFGDRWHTLTPDAFLRYGVGKQALSAFVEVDQGTMTNKRFKEKIERYFAYDVSGRYANHYKGQRFRVLVLVRTPERLANLKGTAAQVAQRHCWFATATDIQQRGLDAQIWETLTDKGKKALF
jgi:hypothetical protein